MSAKRPPAAVLPPAIVAERRHVMAALHPVVGMLGAMVGPQCEVVLHDLTKPEESIVAIANGHVSNRQVGHPILGGPKNDRAFADAKQMLAEHGEAVHTVVAAYPTLTRSGTRLKSSTVIFRDASGTPFAALCLNADQTLFEAAYAWLGGLLHPNGSGAQLAAAETPVMEDLIPEIIADAVQRTGKPVAMMSREDKIRAVRAMMERGLFIVKGGVGRAAEALGVTRFTIYNYLDALREAVPGNGAAETGAAANGAGGRDGTVGKGARARPGDLRPVSSRRRPAR